MSRAELGLFEDDPRSQQGADALAILDSQIKTPAQREFTWAAKDLFVPEKLNLAVIGPYGDASRFENLLK